MNTKEYWEAERKRRILCPSREDLFEGYWEKRYLKNLKYLKRGGRILDIGCGDAKYFIKLSDKFNEFYGVELSTAHFESAKKVFPAANYIVADGNELPFQDSFFDTIISFGAFEHNDEINSIFEECYRILDKNGVLLFSVPNYISTWFPYLYIHHCVIKKHNRVSAIGHHYSKRQLKTKLQRAGFKDVKIVDSIYAAPIPLVGLIAKLVIGIIKKEGVLSSSKPQIAEEKIKFPAQNKLGKLRKIRRSSEYYYSKAFYPLERLGFGFMRMVYCKKGYQE